MLTLLLTSMLTLAFNIQPVKAEGTIYIRGDGSVDPPTAPISTVDNITYTFNGNINDSIVVERDNIVVNGAGYTVQGTGSGDGIGLSGRTNVTIQNTTIKAFYDGIYLGYSSNNSVAGNNITANNWYGIWVEDSSNNNVSGNTITANNYAGIRFYSSSYNSISGNHITNNWDGIVLWSSSYNSVVGNNITANINHGILLYISSNSNVIFGNNITANKDGIFLGYSPNYNSIYHNNFVDNARQVYDFSWEGFGEPSINVWDSGYPSGGNYWSDYVGVDVDGDGIGDTPYIVDADNRDRYPLMEPRKTVSGNLEILEPANGSTIAGPVAITFTIENTGDYIEFLQGDSSNRIDLEIEYRSTGGEIYAWGIMFWSTSYCGLTLRSGEKCEQTLVYDPSEYEGSVPPDFVGDAPYGQTTIRLVHWKRMDEGYGYGEFGVTEINVTLLPADTEPPTVSILSPQNTTYTTTSIPLTFTVNESTYWIGYSLDNQANVTITGNTTLTNLVNGTHSIIVYANDTSGNMGASNMVFFTIQVPPPLSASISPLSASILVGQSVTFTSTVSGGYTPYSYQWYLNGNPVSGATSASWTFTHTTSGIYYIHLKVTDAKANTAQSETARITVATVPVGGYSVPIQVQTKAEPVLPYIALIATLTAIFTKLRPKTKRKR